MNYFIVYAHPEPTSLNGHLRDRAVGALRAAGHAVEVSDLYAMRWKASADGLDFPARDPQIPLSYGKASKEAYKAGAQSPEITEEQRKLLWADFVIFQFPLWWYGMPAILKGWVDRVYAYGFAYGVGEHGGARWGRRFGEGTLEGRRAMVATTVGGRAAQYGPLGVNGTIDDILWPIQHGVFFYPGMTVVPPTVFYEVERATADAVEQMAERYAENLLGMGDVAPIPFRVQNHGDYNQHQVLIAAPGDDAPGLLVHQRAPSYRSNVLLDGPADFRSIHIAPDSRAEAGAPQITAEESQLASISG